MAKGQAKYIRSSPSFTSFFWEFLTGVRHWELAWHRSQPSAAHATFASFLTQLGKHYISPLATAVRGAH